jgi:hypothetical protein
VVIPRKRIPRLRTLTCVVPPKHLVMELTYQPSCLPPWRNIKRFAMTIIFVILIEMVNPELRVQIL